MNIFTSYSCRIIGEDPTRFANLHLSTRDRIKAFSFAIMIPVILWAITGFVIATEIFNIESYGALAIGAVCALFIYMIERIVLVTPKNWGTNIIRLLIGLIIAILGSTTFDIVIFDKEITTQLIQSEKIRLNVDFVKEQVLYTDQIAQKKTDWLTAQNAASCEANGTCGSKNRSVGPIYRQLSNHAELLRQDYLMMQDKLDQLSSQKEKLINNSPAITAKQSGILTRIEALHQFIHHNTYALIAYILFFGLILFFELMVVITKIAFKETVDDQLNALKEKYDIKCLLYF
jgi:hypothetical protein